MVELEQKIEQFLQKYEQVTKENAQEVIAFLMPHESKWFHLSEETFKNVINSICIAYANLYTFESVISFLKNYIEKSPSIVKYAYRHKAYLYLTLSICYALMRNIGKTREAIEKWTFCSLIPRETYNGFVFYSFRTCSDYAIKDLRDNVITVSNPKTFNDPLDCLAFHWIDNLDLGKEEEHTKLVCKLTKEALSYVKLRCFVRNTPLPSYNEEHPVTRSNIEERYNPLMWAHYAGGHTGYCVKYRFPASMTEIEDRYDIEECVLSLWGNVNYKDVVNLDNPPNEWENFFTKSKVWEYENEVRFLHYDPHWKGDFKPINLPLNCVEEVYFGLSCSTENKLKIRDALVGQPVKFFQIETQPHDFYKLTSREV